MYPTPCDSMDWSPPGSPVHGVFPGQNTGVGCHFFLQGIFPTQGSNPGLSRCRQTLRPLSHQGTLEGCDCASGCQGPEHTADPHPLESSPSPVREPPSNLNKDLSSKWLYTALSTFFFFLSTLDSHGVIERKWAESADRTSLLTLQFSSVAQSRPTLCDPMNRSSPGLPVHHQLPDFTQTQTQTQTQAHVPTAATRR